MYVFTVKGYQLVIKGKDTWGKTKVKRNKVSIVPPQWSL